MKKISATLFALTFLAASIGSSHAATPTCSVMTLGQGAGLNGFVPFPSTDPWRQTVAGAAVDPNSAALIAKLGASKVHADFGAGEYDGSYMGIPYVVVSGQAKVKVNYQAYGSESDAGPMPVPSSALYEGYPSTAAGDRHVVVLDRDNCFLYELDDSYLQGDGSWNADAGAVWDLTSNNDRPYKWTSADAAGLPIFPGLTRYDEVEAGQIDHALRFTVASSRKAFVAPATHWASTKTAANLLPMGARLRLKASYDISAFTPQAKIILTALKTYGMIVADNGSNMYLSGTPDSRWNNDDLHELGTVPASAFEVIAMGTPVVATTVPKGIAPAISILKASTTVAVASGTAVTLTWAATAASYYVLSPEIGAVRGTTATVHPTVTTTYTLVANNHFGSTSKTVTVTVK